MRWRDAPGHGREARRGSDPHHASRGRSRQDVGEGTDRGADLVVGDDERRYEADRRAVGVLREDAAVGNVVRYRLAGAEGGVDVDPRPEPGDPVLCINPTDRV